MSVGSNLFLKAALGVAPSCTMALTLSYLSPIHSYALFNFLINSTFLVCEALILHEFGKMQLTQLGLTFVYSLFIEFTSYGLFFIEPHCYQEQRICLYLVMPLQLLLHLMKLHIHLNMLLFLLLSLHNIQPQHQDTFLLHLIYLLL